eukprot:4552197-Amphidinium_carterae.1
MQSWTLCRGIHETPGSQPNNIFHKRTVAPSALYSHIGICAVSMSRRESSAEWASELEVIGLIRSCGYWPLAGVKP